jgi:hypothetical protein
MADVRYSVYRVKDDMPVIIGGTILQCAKACGMTVASFKSSASRQRHNRPDSGAKRNFRIYRDEPISEEE